MHARVHQMSKWVFAPTAAAGSAGWTATFSIRTRGMTGQPSNTSRQYHVRCASCVQLTRCRAHRARDKGGIDRFDGCPRFTRAASWIKFSPFNSIIRCLSYYIYSYLLGDITAARTALRRRVYLTPRPSDRCDHESPRPAPARDRR